MSLPTMSCNAVSRQHLHKTQAEVLRSAFVQLARSDCCPVLHCCIADSRFLESPAPTRRTVQPLTLALCPLAVQYLVCRLFSFAAPCRASEAQALMTCTMQFNDCKEMLCVCRWERRRPQICCALPNQAPPRSCTWRPASSALPQPLSPHPVTHPDAQMLQHNTLHFYSPFGPTRCLTLMATAAPSHCADK